MVNSYVYSIKIRRKCSNTPELLTTGQNTPELLYRLIYSINYAQLPNQTIYYFGIRKLTGNSHERPHENKN